ncbi:GNAT family N-acetyltransferase [Clostridium merdae]|uniref:GNAT family N-acetyltransferase n=1 Tax=Clostridium merdae TaxID=1958780 RepID=UPI000A27085C|nr:GNAT family N-acetyltransferase [Clostridium merdae]
MAQLNQIASIFSGWEKAMIRSCLDGCMGYFLTDDEQNPSAAQIVVGDFCFFAGVPKAALAAKAASPIIALQNAEWEQILQSVWGNRVTKATRYAIRKEPDVFSPERLNGYIDVLDEGYQLEFIEEEQYHSLLEEDWSRDLCSQFPSYEEYRQKGLGVVVTYKGKAVSGASSYCVYSGGLEIEIDTNPEYRRKGLATACGAGLILECLKRGLYPSWDAHDLRSVALAEKLGYHMDYPYTVYIKNDFFL